MVLDCGIGSVKVVQPCTSGVAKRLSTGMLSIGTVGRGSLVFLIAALPSAPSIGLSTPCPSINAEERLTSVIEVSKSGGGSTLIGLLISMFTQPFTLKKKK